MTKERIAKGEGVTGAERYLIRLAEMSFLQLWSYANVYKDQTGGGGATEGKEVCDLLVVCDPHILIFSDKDCAFAHTGSLEQDWARWFRKAVWKSAKQLWGAARWIEQFPDRLFLDKACTRRLPIKLPERSRARVHLIVVAHGSAERCSQELGGSGSLMILPSRQGLPAHTDPSQGGTPFSIGWLEPNRQYVHVLDDFSFELVLQVLDTITDFASYLEKKEAFISSGRLGSASGEEELLALYLQRTDSNKEHCFPMDDDVDRNFLVEGGWEQFIRGPLFKSFVEANRISYAWDQLIEHFSGHILDGSILASSNPEVADLEEMMRRLANVPRFVRRELAERLLDLVLPESDGKRYTRIIPPYKDGMPFFLFMVLPFDGKRPYQQYREVRANLLRILCEVLKLRFPEAREVVGLAFEPGEQSGTTQDAVYRDFSDWSEEHEQYAREKTTTLNLLTDLTVSKSPVWEYPSEQPRNWAGQNPPSPGSSRVDEGEKP